MEIKLALLADYANISREGKLNIMGVFSNILAPSVPAMHPQMQLVMILEVDISETEREYSLEIQLVDMDGQKVMAVDGKMKITKPEVGTKRQIHHTFQINNLVFKNFGDYAFKILINGDLKKDVPLSVVESKTKA